MNSAAIFALCFFNEHKIKQVCVPESMTHDVGSRILLLPSKADPILVLNEIKFILDNLFSELQVFDAVKFCKVYSYVNTMRSNLLQPENIFSRLCRVPRQQSCCLTTFHLLQ
jgi:hypothetical protein